MKRGEVLYHPSKLKRLVERTAAWAVKNPERAALMVKEEDFSMLHHTIGAVEPDYADKKDCYNCGSHMKLAVYTLGVMEALLMFAMAKEVRERTRKGVGFTEANLVHVMTLPTTDAVRHSITRCKYLGLVAQPEKKRNSGYWVITHWGWMLLKGAPVPRYALYWRKKLLERSEDKTTLSEAFRTHTEDVRRAVERRRDIKNDFRATIGEYAPMEWMDFGGYAEDTEDRIQVKPPVDPWWAREPSEKPV